MAGVAPAVGARLRRVDSRAFRARVVSNNENGRRLLRPGDVAVLLNVGVSTVYRLAAQGVLPAFTVPGTHAVRFPSDRLEVLLRRWSAEGFTPQRRNYPKARRKAQRKITQPLTPAGASMQ